VFIARTPRLPLIRPSATFSPQEAVKKSRVVRFASETRSDASRDDEAMLGHR
jgi:hypothetical protein